MGKLKDILRKELQGVKDSFNDSLTVEEVREAKLEMIGLCQLQRFLEEFSSLLRSQNVKQTSHIYKLNPVHDNGILRVGGRLSRDAFLKSWKHLVVLTNDVRISDLILRRLHKEVDHSGRTRVLAHLRLHMTSCSLPTVS